MGGLLLGLLLSGIVVVPIDYRSTIDFVERVNSQVRARVILAGDDVDGKSPKSFPHVWKLADLDWTADGPMPAVPIVRDDVTQIIFTSGATAEPKGVVIRHRNVLANIVPVEREVMKYRKYATVPPASLSQSAAAQSHVRAINGEQHSTDGPRLGDLHSQLQPARHPRPDPPAEGIQFWCASRRSSASCASTSCARFRRRPIPSPSISIPGRWWKYRRVHRAFGLKFWAFVVGAAPLPPDLEEFWRRLGFAVIQGYGLTETAPIVTLNHPFKTSKGSVGTPIEGVEVRIAEDGEILVRGENVTSRCTTRDPGPPGPGILVPGTPDPGSRIESNPESRVPNPESRVRIPNPGS